jgi:hypothetical protein
MRDAWQLSAEARRALRRMRRRPSLIVACWKQADLFEDCHYITRCSIDGAPSTRFSTERGG